MTRVARLVRACTAWVLLGCCNYSQASVAEFEGRLEVGGRLVSVSGDENKYRQHINLDDGARVFALDLRFRPSTANGNAPDLIELRASGLGGDPYENVDFQIREYGSYRFTYARRTSDYFYQDLLIDPAAASVAGSTGGDFHHFDFERVRDSLGLAIHLGERAQLVLDYERYEKSGDSTTVYDISREEFELDQPIDELHETFGATLEYAWDHVTVVLSERLRQYDNASSVLLPGFSPGSDASTPTALDFFFLDQPYHSESHEHQLRVHARPTPRVDLRLSALITDLDLDLETNERAQGIDFFGVPFTQETRGSGDADRKTELYEIAVGYRVADRLRIVGSARRNSLDQTSSVVAGASQGNGIWNIDNTGFQAGVEIMLARGLTVNGGWATERRDSEFRQASEALVDAEDIETERNGYYVDLAYRPNSRLMLSLGFEDDSIDDPFTVASATDSQRLRLQGRYRWSNGTNITTSYRHTKLRNERSGWHSETSQTTVRLAHTSNDWQVSLGATWVELDREIEQLVVGGFRQDLFAIDYAARSDYLDGAVRWQAHERLSVGGSFRRFDNDGSFAAQQHEIRAFAAIALAERYDLEIGYRNVDFEEDDLESFDVDVWELKLQFGW